MRRSPRSVLAVCAALIVALLTAVFVLSDLRTLHERTGSLGPLRDVLVAAHDLPLGATVGAQDVRRVSRYASTIPSSTVTEVDDAVGKVVAVPVLEGSEVRSPHLTAEARDGITGLVPAGYRAVRVQPADGLEPPPGAVVDVLAAADPSIAERSEAEVVAHASRVLAVDAGDDATPDAVGVTLLVTEDEARGLAFAAANGVVTLALAPPEDACCSSPGS